MASAIDFQTAQKLYIAFYQRPADPEGLRFWADQIADAGGSLEQSLNAFATSAEATELFGEITADNIGDVIEQIYQSAFGRGADPEGLDFYTQGFLDGTFSPASIALDIVNGATGTDLAVINNKVAAADRFTNTIDGGERDEEFGQRDPQFSYDADDIQAARDWLGAVTASPGSVPTLAQTLATISTVISNTGDAGLAVPTFTLTTGPDAFVGGDGNNLFSAPLTGAQSDPTQTLGAFDDLDGGAGGADKLEAVLVGNAGSPLIANIEQFFLRSRDDVASLDMSSSTGVEQLWNDRSTNDLSVSDVQAALAIGMTGVAGGTYYNVSYAQGVLVPQQTLVLNNVAQAGTDSATVSVDASGSIDTLVMAVSNGVAIELAGDLLAVSDISITGSGGLDVSGELTQLETLDASTYVGDLDIDLSDTPVLESVVTGAGDDQVKIAAAHFSDSVSTLETVDLGAGENTLFLSDSIGVGAFSGPEGEGETYISGSELGELDFTSADVSGVQTLRFDSVALGSEDEEVELSLDGLDEIETVQFDNFSRTLPDSFSSSYFTGNLTIEDAPSDLRILATGDSGFNMSDASLTLDQVVNLTVETTGEGSSLIEGGLFSKIPLPELTPVLETLTMISEQNAVFRNSFGDVGGEISSLESIDVSAGEDGVVNLALDQEGDGEELDELQSITVAAGNDGVVMLKGREADDQDALDAAVETAKGVVADAEKALEEALLAKGGTAQVLSDAEEAFGTAQTALVAAEGAYTTAESAYVNDDEDVEEARNDLSAFEDLQLAFNAAVDAYLSDQTSANALALVDAYDALVTYDPELFSDELNDAATIAQVSSDIQTTMEGVANALQSEVTTAEQNARNAFASTEEGESLADAISEAEDDLDDAEEARDTAATADEEAQEEVDAARVVLADARSDLQVAIEAAAAGAEASGFSGLEAITVSADDDADIYVEDAAGNFAVVAEAADDIGISLVRTGVTSVLADAGDDIDLGIAGAEDLVSVSLTAADNIDAEISNAGSFTFSAVAEGDADVSITSSDVTSVSVMADEDARVALESVDELVDATIIAGDELDVMISGAELLESLTLTSESDAYIYLEDLDILETVALTVTDEVNASSSLELVDTPAVQTIDLSEVAGTVSPPVDEENSFIAVDVEGANFSGPVSVLIGESDVAFTTDEDNGVRETFTFTGEDGTGEVFISGFNASVGAEGDRLDFSQLDGIDGLDDLVIDFAGDDTIITSNVDGIEVNITIVGQNVADDPLYFEFG